MIATAQYHNAQTRQTASIVIYRSARTYAVCAYIGGEEAEGPTWMERTATETGARQCGNLWHQRLKRNYGMTRYS